MDVTSAMARTLTGLTPRGPHCAGGEGPTYTFQSAPKPLLSKFKYRNQVSDEVAAAHCNIMHDRRVVRGNTFAHHPLPTVAGESAAARQAEARRRAMARRRAQSQQYRTQRLRIGTPPAVRGRRHEDVQTEQYLEELFEYPPTSTLGCQTDFFMDRPATPPYVPAKTGLDTATQIYPGELFHFDTEVLPILEVLVGKTVEQALIEVLEEDELEALRRQQRAYKEIRDTERAEEQRLEEQERRKREEKDKRVLEQEEACRIQRETEDRVAAAVLTTGYIADLLPNVLEGLKEEGFLVDNIKQDVEENFMTWLMSEVKTEMQKLVDNRDLLSEIVREILETRAELYQALGEKDTHFTGHNTSDEDIEEVEPEPLADLELLGEWGEGDKEEIPEPVPEPEVVVPPPVVLPPGILKKKK